MGKEKSNNSHNKRIYFYLSAILLLTIVLYSQTLTSDFVTYDDEKYVLQNTDIRELTLTNIKNYFTEYYMSMYHPLTMLSYALDFNFFGMNPKAFHTVNLIFHLLNVILVFWMIFLLTRKIGLAVFVALFFSIHPMHVESVAWIAERKDVLYTFFFLLSIIYYLWYLDKSLKVKYFFVSILFFILSLLCKSATVVLPVLLLVIDYYKNH